MLGESDRQFAAKSRSFASLRMTIWVGGTRSLASLGMTIWVVGAGPSLRSG
jgi:hypothetical protein